MPTHACNRARTQIEAAGSYAPGILQYTNVSLRTRSIDRRCASL